MESGTWGRALATSKSCRVTSWIISFFLCTSPFGKGTYSSASRSNSVAYVSHLPCLWRKAKKKSPGIELVSVPKLEWHKLDKGLGSQLQYWKASVWQFRHPPPWLSNRHIVSTDQSSKTLVKCTWYFSSKNIPLLSLFLPSSFNCMQFLLKDKSSRLARDWENCSRLLCRWVIYYMIQNIMLIH